MSLFLASLVSAASPVQATPNTFSMTAPVNDQKVDLKASSNWYLPITVTAPSLGRWELYRFTAKFYDTTGNRVLQSEWDVNTNENASTNVEWAFKLGLSNLSYLAIPTSPNIVPSTEVSNFARTTLATSYSSGAFKPGVYSMELYVTALSISSTPELVGSIDTLTIGKPAGVKCAPGSYSATGTWTAKQSCTQAGLGYISKDVASKTQTKAAKGYFTNAKGMISALKCILGSYQPNAGQKTCIQASAGYFVPSMASTTQTACPRGRYTSGRGSSNCALAEPGTYVSLTGQTSVTSCAAGKYQPDFGKAFCRDADPGYFVPFARSTNQLACPAGMYQSSSNGTECLSAPAGSFAYGQLTDGNGATAAVRCSLGTYSNSIGNSQCSEAEIGFYVNTSGAVMQTACPVGKITPGRRSTSALDCSVDAPSL